MTDTATGTGCTCRGTELTHGREGDAARLRFVTRIEQLGIDGDDLSAVVRAYDGGDCGTTQQTLAYAVDTRLAAAQTRVVELVEHAARLRGDAGPGLRTPPAVDHVQVQTVELGDQVIQLQAAAAHLAAARVATGGCGDGCPCTTDWTTTKAGRIPLSRAALEEVTMDGPDLACTLAGGADAMRVRITDWQAVTERATGREAVDGGVAMTFPHDIALTSELARLAAAEYECCSFFSFSITVDGDGVRFSVHAPDDARDVITAIFSVAPEAPANSAAPGPAAPRLGR